MPMPLIERIARSSGSGYLDRVWREANGDWMTPREEDLRSFLSALSREVEN